MNRNKTVSLAEREGLQSVIDNARKHAEAGYPDFTESDPATFDADFVINKEREGMSISQALGLGLGGGVRWETLSIAGKPSVSLE